MIAALILDLLIVGIIVLCIFLSARYGFARTLVEVIGFAAALIVAFTISSPLADITYDKMVEPAIEEKIVEALDSGSAVSDNLWDSLPQAVKNYSPHFGITKDAFGSSVDAVVSKNADDISKKVSADVIKPIIVRLLGIIYSSLISVILIVLVKIAAKYVNEMFSISVAGKINTVLGGVFGLIKGAAIVFVFCLAVGLITAITKNGFGIFTQENIDSTFIFKHIYGILPIN